MSAFGIDVCGRCLTTHPLNEQGERPCPKPVEVKDDESGVTYVPVVIFKGNGFYTTDNRRILRQSDVL